VPLCAHATDGQLRSGGRADHESTDFTPYEMQRSKPFEVVLNATSDEPVIRDDTALGQTLAIGGLPAQWKMPDRAES